MILRPFRAGGLSGLPSSASRSAIALIVPTASPVFAICLPLSIMVICVWCPFCRNPRAFPLQIRRVRVGTEPDLLRLVPGGVLPLNLLLLALLVAEFPVVHDPADGRPLVGANLDEVQLRIAAIRRASSVFRTPTWVPSAPTTRTGERRMWSFMR